MSFLVCANSIIEHYHFFVPFFSFRNYFTRSVFVCRLPIEKICDKIKHGKASFVFYEISAKKS